MNAGIALFVTVMTFMGLAAWLINNMIKARRAPGAGAGAEAARQIAALRAENDRLHERLSVLERIATDPARRTAREIEELR